MDVPRKMRSSSSTAGRSEQCVASGNLFCVRKDGNHAQLLRIDSINAFYWLMSQAGSLPEHAINIKCLNLFVEIKFSFPACIPQGTYKIGTKIS
jgi:hypothetical protein